MIEIIPLLLFIIGYTLFVACFFFRDILYLRALATIGQIAFIPYFIYADRSILWAPYVGVICTLMLVVINSAYIWILLNERKPVKLTSLEAGIYLKLFNSLSTSIFQKLFRLGKPLEFAAGTQLISRGSKLDNLYLVLNGEFDVVLLSGEHHTLQEGHFIGEMSFVSHESASADVHALTPRATVLAWDTLTLIQHLDKSPQLSNSFDLILSTDVTAKLRRMSESM